MSKRPASADDKQPKRAKKDETDTTATLGHSAVRALAAELQAGVSHVERCLSLLASGHTVPFIARYRAHETGGMEPPLLRRIEAVAKEAANLAARCDAIVATLRKADRLTAELERELRAAPTLSALEAVYAPHKAKPCSLAERCCGPVHRRATSRNLTLIQLLAAPAATAFTDTVVCRRRCGQRLAGCARPGRGIADAGDGTDR